MIKSQNKTKNKTLTKDQSNSDQEPSKWFNGVLF